MFRVVQTVPAFRYPAGKIWGPYVEEVDAQQRLGTLREFKGDGVIESGEFGAPCGMHLVGAGGPGGVMASA
ncbi:hypothetical protein [Streptomyces chryseus]|uniref:hypothetical protein n=1 Tax=Streptomyces chryseus TaxID=68186 RepID=UPI00110FAE05|nr:hypothetical protein [Streptomyces chryseus]GGX26708.1 hypothetical protein GCM10010353_47250 [Streptomyces chryseus]